MEVPHAVRWFTLSRVYPTRRDAHHETLTRQDVVLTSGYVVAVQKSTGHIIHVRRRVPFLSHHRYAQRETMTRHNPTPYGGIDV